MSHKLNRLIDTFFNSTETTIFVACIDRVTAIFYSRRFVRTLDIKEVICRVGRNGFILRANGKQIKFITYCDFDNPSTFCGFTNYAVI